MRRLRVSGYFSSAFFQSIHLTLSLFDVKAMLDLQVHAVIYESYINDVIHLYSDALYSLHWFIDPLRHNGTISFKQFRRDF